MMNHPFKLKNEASIYDVEKNSVAEWGTKFNATSNSFSSKDDQFSLWIEKMLERLPGGRKMNIASFQLSNDIVKTKFIHALKRISETKGIELTFNGYNPENFVFYKNEKI